MKPVHSDLLRPIEIEVQGNAVALIFSPSSPKGGGPGMRTHFIFKSFQIFAPQRAPPVH
jgi:hypothetical protein